MALTVKGKPISSTQLTNAQILVAIGNQQAASNVAIEAALFAAIMESDMGADPGTWSGTYGGILQGQKQYFSQYGTPGSQAVTEQQAESFFAGKNGFHTAPSGITSIYLYAAAVEGSGTQYASESFPIGSAEQEAIALASSYKVAAGGVAGLGGTGTQANDASPWTTVGDPSNPDQDYWTTANQYAQEAQWYLFSDGEVMYCADGIYLMAQRPAAVIARTDPRCLSMEVTWDNTTFDYAVTKHTLQKGTQRRATLARNTSPTEANIKWICGPDDIRGGDTIYILGMGPGDGLWLVSDCSRSYFQVYSTLQCVQASMPLSAESGYTISGQQELTATQAIAPGSGSVVSLILAEANALGKDGYPYVWGGGHARAGYPDRGTVGQEGNTGSQVGFDCSGAVGAIMGYANVGQAWGSPILGDAALYDAIQSTGELYPGQGTGTPEVTIFNAPGVHIYMRINGRMFSYSGTGLTNGWQTSMPTSGTIGPATIRCGHLSSAFLKTVASQNNVTTPSATSITVT